MRRPWVFTEIKEPWTDQGTFQPVYFLAALLEMFELPTKIGFICQSGKIMSLHAPDEERKKFINSVCMAASTCLWQCNQMLSATNYKSVFFSWMVEPRHWKLKGVPSLKSLCPIHLQLECRQKLPHLEVWKLQPGEKIRHQNLSK